MRASDGLRAALWRAAIAVFAVCIKQICAMHGRNDVFYLVIPVSAACALVFFLFVCFLGLLLLYCFLAILYI